MRGPKTITRKILEAHLVSGNYTQDQEIGIRIDQTLTQDALGTMAYMQFEALGIDRVKTELSVSYIDHNTIQIGPENADDHKYLQTIAARCGAVFSPAGNGICHQLHVERFAIPGKTLLGSDSHTCTSGAMGMIAIGAGGLDVAVAMGGGSFYLACPRVIEIELTGRLSTWVSAKDVVLRVLQLFSTKGNVGTVFEYAGAGVETLSVPERATIANMGAECGVTTSVFPSDEKTRDFLRAQGREKDWIAISADPGAVYDRVIQINLSEVVPMVACPHSPENVKTVKELAGLKLNQVCVGSCTNSSYRDLMVVSHILKNRSVYPGLNLVVAPGSRQVLQMLNDSNSIGELLASGVRLLENACGFCVGNSQSPHSNGVSLRTNNRNYLGRSGTKNAQVYLCSPETAIVSALAGELVDPRNSGIPYPSIELPAKFPVPESDFIFPPETSEALEIHRGPHMGPLPVNRSFPEAIAGKVTIKLGDNISTDHIVTAGDRMKYRSNVEKYSEYVFEVVDKAFYKRALSTREKNLHNIIVAGFSYGQGSSREHAALCPMYLGVKCILAKSFERIHHNNLINFGIAPFTFLDTTDYDRIDQGDDLKIGDIQNALQNKDGIQIVDETKHFKFKVSLSLSKREREILLAGGKLAYLMKSAGKT